MASIRKRGETFTITAYMGYDEQGKQIKKTTTYRPPEGVTAGKAEKLAKAFAAQWEDKVRGYVALDENRTFAELAKWYYESVAPLKLKDNVRIDNMSIINTYIMPTLARKKLKEITPAMLDALFAELRKSGRTKDTYKLIEGCSLPKGSKDGNNSISGISRRTGIARATIQRLSDGRGIEKGNAEKIAAALNVRFDDMFISDMQDRSLEESSISRIRRCLSAIFTAAVQKEIMRRNPVANTVIISKKSRKPVSFLDETQALALVQHLEQQHDFQYKVMINTLLFTGMRGGELCGLQWQDIDFEKGIIHIRHTLAYVRNVGQERGPRPGSNGKRASVYELQSPKTAAGERYVVIPQSLKGLLIEHKARQERACDAASEWVHPEMVFTTTGGNFYSESYLNARFKKTVRALGLPQDTHLHSLRHTTASLLINSDVSPKLIADQLGHASSSITQDIYSHIFASSRAKAAQALDLKLNPTNA